MPAPSNTRPTTFFHPDAPFGAIGLPNGLWTLVDPDVAAEEGTLRWHLDSNQYVQRMVRAPRTVPGGGLEPAWKRICLHRVIAGVQCPMTGENLGGELQVDHINGDKLDNRRVNLRLLAPREHQRATRARILR